MKTKEQVIRQLRLFKFDDATWEQVRDFCKDRFKNGINKPFKGKYECTFEQFINWFDNGYGAGDMVYYGRTIAILNYEFQGDLCFCGYFDMNDRLVDCPDLYYPVRSECKLVEGTDLEYYWDKVNEAGYYLMKSNGRLFTKAPVKKDAMFSLLIDKVKYYGLVKYADDKLVQFYYAYSENDFINHEIMVPRTDVYDFIEKLAADRIEEQIAAKHHVRWSQPEKALIFLPQRVAFGKMYYYITDKFTITGTTENGNKSAEMRCNMGNYFSSFEDATKFLIEARRLRSQLVSDGKIK